MRIERQKTEAVPVENIPSCLCCPSWSGGSGATRKVQRTGLHASFADERSVSAQGRTGSARCQDATPRTPKPGCSSHCTCCLPGALPAAQAPPSGTALPLPSGQKAEQVTKLEELAPHKGKVLWEHKEGTPCHAYRSRGERRNGVAARGSGRGGRNSAWVEGPARAGAGEDNTLAHYGA